jgi:hypothetical protein
MKKIQSKPRLSVGVIQLQNSSFQVDNRVHIIYKYQIRKQFATDPRLFIWHSSVVHLVVHLFTDV